MNFKKQQNKSPIDEILISGTSLSLVLRQTKVPSNLLLGAASRKEDAQFNLIGEQPGFHDCDFNIEMVRGYFSMVVTFEVDHVVSGVVTKTLLKRIETCEFIAADGVLWMMGKPIPMKILEHSISAITGYGIAPIEFDFREMSQLQERMKLVKSVTLSNSKDKKIRTVKMSGDIESYTDCSVIDPQHHGIESVCGLVDSPLGPITVTVTKKGGVRLGVRRGFIANLGCLEWLLRLIREEHVAAI